MLQLKTRTEFSFREVYGPVARVLESTAGPIGICDRGGTWGHIAFWKACKKAERKCLLGMEVAVVEDARLREK
jgi:DNA polymerase III alpha subunit